MPRKQTALLQPAAPPAALQPIPDPRDASESKARAAVHAAAEDLDAYDIKLISAAVEAIGKADGTEMWPAASFVKSVLESYWSHKGITPDDARDEVEGFAQRFDAMRLAAAEFDARYGL
jgi:hypothetical protein